MLRVVHYPPLDDKKDAVRSAPHGDICLFTILVMPTAKGLELLDQNGSWYTPDLNELNVVIFNSDMIEVATNGHLKSAEHQVTKKSHTSIQKSRYSIPFFIHPSRQAVLKQNFTAGDYLRERLFDTGFDGNKLIINDGA